MITSKTHFGSHSTLPIEESIYMTSCYGRIDTVHYLLLYKPAESLVVSSFLNHAKFDI